MLHIEATRYPGKGNIILTGHIGEVMKESVQAALSLLPAARANWGSIQKIFAKWTFTCTYLQVPFRKMVLSRHRNVYRVSVAL